MMESKERYIVGERKKGVSRIQAKMEGEGRKGQIERGGKNKGRSIERAKGKDEGGEMERDKENGSRNTGKSLRSMKPIFHLLFK